MKYTPETPFTIYLRPRQSEGELWKNVHEAIAEHGGVTIWHCLDLSSSRRYWIAYDADTTAKPHWSADDPEVITDERCIAIKPPQPGRLVTRTYMDLRLFSLAAEAARVRLRIEVYVMGNIEHVKVDDLVDYLEKNPTAEPTVLVLHHSREAYNGSGYREGTETYEATLPIVPVEDGDDFGAPEAAKRWLGAWLVRVDSAAMGSELTDAPEEAEVKSGWRHVVSGQFVEGDECPEGDDWKSAVSIDGEIMSGEEYESWESSYYRPEADFVWQEMESVLESILRVAPRYEFDRIATDLLREAAGPKNVAPVWMIVDAYGNVLDTLDLTKE